MNNKDSNDLSHHILPNSATMVGACIMVISIVKSMSPGLENYLIDKALAIDIVMLSACLSFLSIRTEQYSVRLEGFAEIIFLIGLGSMTIITVIFSFQIILKGIIHSGYRQSMPVSRCLFLADDPYWSGKLGKSMTICYCCVTSECRISIYIQEN
jgi:hypothetical protein